MPPGVGTRNKQNMAGLIQKNWKQLCEWQLEIARNCPPPFYCSIDLRDSGHKIAPVDSNLYPAGFNNLCADDIRTAPQVVRIHLGSLMSDVNGGPTPPKRILILPEAHTQNRHYAENLYYLCQVIAEAGPFARSSPKLDPKFVWAG
jgi:glutamate--cysteine ligase